MVKPTNIRNSEFLEGEEQPGERMRELFYELYRMFPNGRISEKRIREVIVTEEDRENLVKYGYLTEEEVSGEKQYGLGPNGLQLITSWNVEKINKRMYILTISLVVLTLRDILPRIFLK